MSQETLVLTLKSQMPPTDLAATVATVKHLLETVPPEQGLWEINHLNPHQAKETLMPVIGVIIGIIKAVSQHPGLNFTLVDNLTQQNITCFFEPTQQDSIGQLWGKRVMVTGMIWRDSVTGYPLTISSINQIEPSPEPLTQSYKVARGLIAWRAGDELAEISIRRLRDGRYKYYCF